MTHRPYTPPSWQAKPLADGRVTLLVVPLKVQPYTDEGVIYTWSGKDSAFLCGPSDLAKNLMKHGAAPYAPGDLIWCREAWNITHTSDLAPGEVIGKTADECAADNGGFATPCGDGIVYRSEGAENHPVYGKAIWRPSVTMPKWAARTWLRCTGVEVRRVQTISEDEAFNTGIEVDVWDQAPVARNYKTGAWFVGWSMGVQAPNTETETDEVCRASFASALPNFAANPWAAFVAVEKISKEDV